MKPADSDVRANLLNAAAQLERMAAEQNEGSIRSAAQELAGKIQQNRFHLVVVGQFKRGKTTFLNALLGEPVLPVAVLPLTSIVTVLRYGDTPRATVFFQSGRQAGIRLDQLPEYVTESGNPRNRKLVGHAEVFYPSDYLRGSVTLIDTPGIASVYAHNTQVTYDFLPRIDAAIFITSPEPPVTSAEIEFLADLLPQVSKTFIVMNKADLVDASHLSEVLEFARRSLPAALANDPSSVFAVSARQALEAKLAGDQSLLERSGFPELEAQLNRFLRDEKGRVFLQSVSRNLFRLIADLRMYLALQVQAAMMPVEELRARISAFDEHLNSARQQQEDNALLLKGNLARLSSTFENQAKSFAESQLDPMLSTVRACFEKSRSLSRRQLASAMDRFLAQQLERQFDRWRADFEPSAVASFREITERFQKQVNELILKVRETAGTLFGVEIERLEASEELAFLEPTGYHTDPALDWGLGSAPLLLPAGLFHRYLLRRVLKNVADELERNATRVAYDLKRRLDKSVSAFERTVKGKLTETIGGLRRVIQSALERHESGSLEVEELVARLSAAVRQLDQVADNVHGALSELDTPVEAR
jgi:GTPase SAR1 family protein